MMKRDFITWGKKYDPTSAANEGNMGEGNSGKLKR
ncbi:hypothetical protein E2C01_068375 [Portunus trituberculatus]|uniref:Uncharacterized protein n=1 Tax=Portunus trituberculatus TaxID=210409 RepID=A0A5B7HNN9_PORTR|nr:hypothetical protein [Portunus trituberculatus]